LGLPISGRRVEERVGSFIDGLGEVPVVRGSCSLGRGGLGVADQPAPLMGYARGGGGFEVAGLVADGDGLGGVEAEGGDGVEEHAGGGFAPGVFAGVGGEGALRVVGAVAVGVDGDGAGDRGPGGLGVGCGGDAGVDEEAIEAVVDAFDIVFGVPASGDAALVGEDDEAVAGVSEAGEGLGGAWDELDLVGVAEVARGHAAFAADDGVVAVEEGGGVHGMGRLGG